MKRKLAVLSIGLATFVVVTASAASIGGGVSTKYLSADNATVYGCGNPGSVTVSYQVINNAGVPTVDAVDLTAGTGEWTAGTGGQTSCVGKVATVRLNGTTTIADITITAEMLSSSNRLLTLNISPDVATEAVDYFSIVLQGGP